MIFWAHTFRDSDHIYGLDWSGTEYTIASSEAGSRAIVEASEGRNEIDVEDENLGYGWWPRPWKLERMP